MRSARKLIETGWVRGANFRFGGGLFGVRGLHSVDCLILDAQLPGMSGLELQRYLGANGFQPPVIFVTQDKDGQVVKALRGGALAFLRKPFEDEDLLVRVVQSACTQ